MLIDWISATLDWADCPHWGGWLRGRTWGEKIMRYDPANGRVVWETSAWDSVRSDSHQVAIQFSGSSLRVQGSPGRCMGDGDAVFGAGAAGRDLVTCLHAMIAHVSRALCIFPFPSFRLWRVTRVDVTANYLLPSLASVRVALAELRNVEGGRYRVSQQAGDTVYWSHRSRYRAGKAYAKGPHLRYMSGRPGVGRVYSDSDVALADRLIRMELRLGSAFWREARLTGRRWYNFTWDTLYSEHSAYFGRMLGLEGVEVADMGMVERCVKVAPSRGQGLAAARTWAVIQAVGWQAARDSMPERTWYRHLGVLRGAGLGDADISAGRLVSIRRPLVFQPVSSWDELRRVA